VRRDAGQPLPRQSSVAVGQFSAVQLDCLPGLAGARVRLGGTIPLEPGPEAPGSNRRLDLEINGTVVQQLSLTPRNRALALSEVVTVDGASGTHQLVVLLDGVVRSPAYSFGHSCLTTRPTAAPAPGAIRQQTAFSFVAQVRDGLRPDTSSTRSSMLQLVLETTDGRRFEFTRRGGVPNNSVLRIDGTVPLELTRDTLHRVRLYIDGAPLTGLDALADAGDSASFGWMLIETGAGVGPRPRIYETGAVDLTIPPRQWWQSPVLSMRRVSGSTPVTGLRVGIATGADDLRTGPLEPRFQSVIEVAIPVQSRTAAGLTLNDQLVLTGLDDEQARRVLGLDDSQTLAGLGLPAHLTPAETASIQTAGEPTARSLRIRRMQRAFLIDRDGVRPRGSSMGATVVRPFGAYGYASVSVAAPPGLTLRDLASLFVRVDLGTRGNAVRDGIGTAMVGADQWDYAGSEVSYQTEDGSWHLLYSDFRPERVSGSKTFILQVPDQTWVQ
jgi:hypothetical protein